MKSELVIPHKAVVLGETPDSLRFAVQYNFPLITTTQLLIYDMEIPGHGKELKKEIINLRNILGIFGKYFQSENVTIQQESNCIRFSKNNFTVTFQFETLFVFDDYGCQGLPPYYAKKNKGQYFVVDWLGLDHRRTRQKDVLGVEMVNCDLHWLYPSRFISDVLFYPRVFAQGSKIREERKDAVVFSHLNQDELESVDYSGAVVRMFVDDLINKQLKIPGQIRYGRGPNRKERTRFLIYITHIKRDKFRLEQNLYEDTENIKFMIGYRNPVVFRDESMINLYYRMYREEEIFNHEYPNDRPRKDKSGRWYIFGGDNTSSKEPKIFSK